MADLVPNPFAPNSEDENGEYWDPWDALGIQCGGYSSAVDQQAINVLRAIRDSGPDGRFVTDIAKKTGMSEPHVELWQYLFCSANWCDYGTSPRGCFPEYGLDFDALVTAWETYFERTWSKCLT